MNSLKDVYARIVEQEKLAQEGEPDLEAGGDDQTKLAVQQAYEYDLVGRKLAQHVFADIVKEAAEDLPVGHGPGHKHDDGMPCTSACDRHGSGAEHAEKKASLTRAILENMARDPSYVAELVAKHQRA